MSRDRKEVALAYSGGLDSTALLILLKERYGFDQVMPVLVDGGQGEEDVKIAKERAEILGEELVFFDVKKEFAAEYVHKCIGLTCPMRDILLGPPCPVC